MINEPDSSLEDDNRATDGTKRNNFVENDRDEKLKNVEYRKSDVHLNASEIQNVIDTIKEVLSKATKSDQLASGSSNFLGMKVKDSLMLKVQNHHKKELPFDGFKSSVVCRVAMENEMRVPPRNETSINADNENSSTKQKKSVSLADDVKVLNQTSCTFSTNSQSSEYNSKQTNNVTQSISDQKHALKNNPSESEASASSESQHQSVGGISSAPLVDQNIVAEGVEEVVRRESSHKDPYSQRKLMVMISNSSMFDKPKDNMETTGNKMNKYSSKNIISPDLNEDEPDASLIKDRMNVMRRDSSKQFNNKSNTPSEYNKLNASDTENQQFIERNFYSKSRTSLNRTKSRDRTAINKLAPIEDELNSASSDLENAKQKSVISIKSTKSLRRSKKPTKIGNNMNVRDENLKHNDDSSLEAKKGNEYLERQRSGAISDSHEGLGSTKDNGLSSEKSFNWIKKLFSKSSLKINDQNTFQNSEEFKLGRAENENLIGNTSNFEEKKLNLNDGSGMKRKRSLKNLKGSQKSYIITENEMKDDEFNRKESQIHSGGETAGNSSAENANSIKIGEINFDDPHSQSLVSEDTWNNNIGHIRVLDKISHSTSTETNDEPWIITGINIKDIGSKQEGAITRTKSTKTLAKGPLRLCNNDLCEPGKVNNDNVINDTRISNADHRNSKSKLMESLSKLLLASKGSRGKSTDEFESEETEILNVQGKDIDKESIDTTKSVLTNSNEIPAKSITIDIPSLKFNEDVMNEMNRDEFRRPTLRLKRSVGRNALSNRINSSIHSWLATVSNDSKNDLGDDDGANQISLDNSSTRSRKSSKNRKPLVKTKKSQNRLQAEETSPIREQSEHNPVKNPSRSSLKIKPRNQLAKVGDEKLVSRSVIRSSKGRMAEEPFKTASKKTSKTKSRNQLVKVDDEKLISKPLIGSDEHHIVEPLRTVKSSMKRVSADENLKDEKSEIFGRKKLSQSYVTSMNSKSKVGKDSEKSSDVQPMPEDQKVLRPQSSNGKFKYRQNWSNRSSRKASVYQNEDILLSKNRSGKDNHTSKISIRQREFEENPTVQENLKRNKSMTNIFSKSTLKQTTSNGLLLGEEDIESESVIDTDRKKPFVILDKDKIKSNLISNKSSLQSYSAVVYRDSNDNEDDVRGIKKNNKKTHTNKKSRINLREKENFVPVIKSKDDARNSQSKSHVSEPAVRLNIDHKAAVIPVKSTKSMKLLFSKSSLKNANQDLVHGQKAIEIVASNVQVRDNIMSNINLEAKKLVGSSTNSKPLIKKSGTKLNTSKESESSSTENNVTKLNRKSKIFRKSTVDKGNTLQTPSSAWDIESHKSKEEVIGVYYISPSNTESKATQATLNIRQRSLRREKSRSKFKRDEVSGRSTASIQSVNAIGSKTLEKNDTELKENRAKDNNRRMNYPKAGRWWGSKPLLKDEMDGNNVSYENLKHGVVVANVEGNNSKLNKKTEEKRGLSASIKSLSRLFHKSSVKKSKDVNNVAVVDNGAINNTADTLENNEMGSHGGRDEDTDDPYDEQRSKTYGDERYTDNKDIQHLYSAIIKGSMRAEHEVYEQKETPAVKSSATKAELEKHCKQEMFFDNVIDSTKTEEHGGMLLSDNRPKLEQSNRPKQPPGQKHTLNMSDIGRLFSKSSFNGPGISSVVAIERHTGVENLCSNKDTTNNNSESTPETSSGIIKKAVINFGVEEHCDDNTLDNYGWKRGYRNTDNSESKSSLEKVKPSRTSLDDLKPNRISRVGIGNDFQERGLNTDPIIILSNFSHRSKSPISKSLTTSVSNSKEMKDQGNSNSDINKRVEEKTKNIGYHLSRIFSGAFGKKDENKETKTSESMKQNVNYSFETPNRSGHNVLEETRNRRVTKKTDDKKKDALLKKSSKNMKAQMKNKSTRGDEYLATESSITEPLPKHRMMEGRINAENTKGNLTEGDSSTKSLLSGYSVQSFNKQPELEESLNDRISKEFPVVTTKYPLQIYAANVKYVKYDTKNRGTQVNDGMPPSRSDLLIKKHFSRTSLKSTNRAIGHNEDMSTKGNLVNRQYRKNNKIGNEVQKKRSMIRSKGSTGKSKAKNDTQMNSTQSTQCNIVIYSAQISKDNMRSEKSLRTESKTNLDPSNFEFNREKAYKKDEIDTVEMSGVAMQKHNNLMLSSTEANEKAATVRKTAKEQSNVKVQSSFSRSLKKLFKKRHTGSVSSADDVNIQPNKTSESANEDQEMDTSIHDSNPNNPLKSTLKDKLLNKQIAIYSSIIKLKNTGKEENIKKRRESPLNDESTNLEELNYDTASPNMKSTEELEEAVNSPPSALNTLSKMDKSNNEIAKQDMRSTVKNTIASFPVQALQVNVYTQGSDQKPTDSKEEVVQYDIAEFDNKTEVQKSVHDINTTDENESLHTVDESGLDSQPMTTTGSNSLLAEFAEEVEKDESEGSEDASKVASIRSFVSAPHCYIVMRQDAAKAEADAKDNAKDDAKNDAKNDAELKEKEKEEADAEAAKAAEYTWPYYILGPPIDAALIDLRVTIRDVMAKFEDSPSSTSMKAD